MMVNDGEGGEQLGGEEAAIPPDSVANASQQPGWILDRSAESCLCTLIQSTVCIGRVYVCMSSHTAVCLLLQLRHAFTPRPARLTVLY